MVKNMPANAGDVRDSFNPWVGKTPWRRAWQPTPVFLPEESHGQRRQVGYSPWGRKESDTTEGLTLSLLYTIKFFESHNVIVVIQVNILFGEIFAGFYSFMMSITYPK